MNFSSLCPVLWTEKLNETIDFYAGTLGFTLEGRSDDWGWARLRRDAVEIMLSKPNEHMHFEKPAFTGSFYIETDEVDLLWQNLKDKVKLCYPIEDFDWEMREFAVYDNNGYIIQFGQRIQK